MLAFSRAFMGHPDTQLLTSSKKCGVFILIESHRLPQQRASYWGNANVLVMRLFGANQGGTRIAMMLPGMCSHRYPIER